MKKLVDKGVRLENIVLNAGVLKYPNVRVWSDLLEQMLIPPAESHRDVCPGTLPQIFSAWMLIGTEHSTTLPFTYILTP